MPEFRIRIALDHLLPADAPVNRDILSNLAHAVEHIAQSAHAQWVAYASGAPLPDGRVIGTRTGTYLRSIQLDRRGDFEWEVFADAPHADAIEAGMPARDLKTMLNTSFKVRVTKDGKRYLIIPFRWGTPGTVTFGKNVMPSSVHRLWTGVNKLQSSMIVGHSRRLSGTGAWSVKTHQPVTVRQRHYLWGDRVTGGQLKQAGVTGQQARHMQGMVRMDRPGGRHSQFMTFRVMSEDSSGWLAPARPGYWPARTVAEKVEAEAERLFVAAVEADVRQWLGGLGG